MTHFFTRKVCLNLNIVGWSNLSFRELPGMWTSKKSQSEINPSEAEVLSETKWPPHLSNNNNNNNNNQKRGENENRVKVIQNLSVNLNQANLKYNFNCVQNQKKDFNMISRHSLLSLLAAVALIGCAVGQFSDYRSGFLVQVIVQLFICSTVHLPIC